MEEIKVLLIEKWPEILSYVLNLVAYFLFLLYRSKFAKTKDSMLMSFTEKVGDVNKSEEAMRQEMLAERAATQNDLLAAIKEYEESKKEFDALTARLKRTESALLSVIEEEVING